MKRIFHLVAPAIWESQAKAPAYRADSLGSEGFIHCSTGDQVAGSANRFYADHDCLLLLHIDPDRLTSPLREEASGSGEVFPHIYGPINREAVVEVTAMKRGPDGRWRFPS
jgi:glutathione S-transferase